jgi:hypothetical protein
MATIRTVRSAECSLGSLSLGREKRVDELNKVRQTVLGLSQTRPVLGNGTAGSPTLHRKLSSEYTAEGGKIQQIDHSVSVGIEVAPITVV